MQSSSVTGVSPSFTTHSSNNLADVAARVVQEFRRENGDDYDDIFNFNDYDYPNGNGEFSVPADDKPDTPEKTKDENDDDEFEFAIVCTDVNSSSISADYPLFDRSLLLDVDPDLIKVVNATEEADRKPSSLVVRLPLRKLFSEDRDFCSSSSSEADDLDGIAPGTYCVWKPKTRSPEKCKKSKSTGNSSRRWKLRDILYRSNSDSKESPFLFFKPAMNKNEKVKKVEKIATVGDSASEKKDPANKAENSARRRQSYLPSGQALVGAFTTVSRSNRNLHPF